MCVFLANMDLMAFLATLLRAVEAEHPEACNIHLPAELSTARGNVKSTSLLLVYVPTWDGLAMWYATHTCRGREARSDLMDVTYDSLPEHIELFDMKTANWQYAVEWPEEAWVDPERWLKTMGRIDMTFGKRPCSASGVKAAFAAWGTHVVAAM